MPPGEETTNQEPAEDAIDRNSAPAVDRVEEASEESFPASDAPAWLPLHIGGRAPRS